MKQTIGLLVVGIALWLSMGRVFADFANQLPALMSAVVIGVLMLIPAARRVGVESIQSINARLQNRIGLSAFIVAIVASGYLAFTAVRQGRYLAPYWHDELAYLVQMRMVADGKFWMPAHPVAEHFETFYLITDRVYASIYFPGTALLYAPEIWLGLPLITFPLLASGLAVGVTFWLLAKLIDPVSGLAGALLMISIPVLRLASIMLMSNIPVLLMGVLLLWSFMQWQRERRLGWAVAMGFFAGWAAVCRPVEALSFAIPVGLGILVRMREWHWRPRIETAALVVTGALPFLILQVILNHNITGNWRVPAWQYYSNRDFPQTTMGFREFDPTLRPISKLPQKQNIFDHFVPHAVAEHQPHLVPKQWLNFRGPALLAGTMPSSLLAIFLPVGLAACRRDWRWVVAGVLPVFILLYSISVVFQVYYPIVVIPAALLLILLGMHTISGLFGRFAQTIRTALLLWAALTAIVSLPEAGRRVKDRLFEPVLIKQIDQWERNYGGPRGIVLFRYTPRRNMHEEPVYNTTTAWPDDARIIRAQDLGENSRLFEYYAKIQPDREVFFFDEITNTATRLGTVAELARRK